MEYCKICRNEIIYDHISVGKIKKIIGGLAHEDCINEFSEHEKIKLFYNESDYIYLDYLNLLNHEIEDNFGNQLKENKNEIYFIDYNFVEKLPNFESIDQKKKYIKHLIERDRKKIRKRKENKEDLLFQFINHISYDKVENISLSNKLIENLSKKTFKFIEKVESLQEITNINEFDYLAWFSLGKILLADNRLETPELSLKFEILERYFGKKGFIHLGDICFELHQYMYAIKYYNIWLKKIENELSQSRWQIAKVYEKLGKIYFSFGKSAIDKKYLLNQAETYFLKAIELFSLDGTQISSNIGVYKRELFEFKIQLLNVYLVTNKEKANEIITELLRGDHPYMRRFYRILIDIKIKQSIIDPSTLETVFKLIFEFKEKFEPQLDIESYAKNSN